MTSHFTATHPIQTGSKMDDLEHPPELRNLDEAAAWFTRVLEELLASDRAVKTAQEKLQKAVEETNKLLSAVLSVMSSEDYQNARR